MAGEGPYGKWVVQGPPSVQPPAAEQVRLRLFCLPPAGMGGACYHCWTQGLPEGVELMPLELPCRGTRLGEALPYASSLVQLASDVLDGLGLDLLRAKPFVVFGHSFGAWVAFELCQELVRRAASGWPLPLKVYVSGCRAPQLAGARNDPDRVSPTLGNLPEPEFWEAFERRAGRNPDLQAPYIREFVRGFLQADFRLTEAYVPSSVEPLPFPLCAVCAKGDNRCRPGQLSAWVRCAPQGGFQERWFQDGLKPGSWATEHRYVADSPGSLLRFLHGDLPHVGRPVPGDTGVAGPLPGSCEEEALQEAPGAADEQGRRACMIL